MGIVKQQLAPHVCRAFATPTMTTFAPDLSPPLQLLYEDFNGGLFWSGALVIRPVQRAERAPLTIAEWNDEALWRGEYGQVFQDATFFAEDAFGFQFGIIGERVVQLHPETAAMTPVAETIDGWCQELLREPEFYTGFPVLVAWEQKHGPVKVGYRLIPKQLFMFGGEYDSNNMVCKPDVEGMLIRAQLWKLTKDLPDGQKIVFTIED